jgi:hypothetical protein
VGGVSVSRKTLLQEDKRFLALRSNKERGKDSRKADHANIFCSELLNYPSFPKTHCFL